MLNTRQVKCPEQGEGWQQFGWDIIQLIVGQTEVRQVGEDSLVLPSPPVRPELVVGDVVVRHVEHLQGGQVAQDILADIVEDVVTDVQILQMSRAWTKQIINRADIEIS